MGAAQVYKGAEIVYNCTGGELMTSSKNTGGPEKRRARSGRSDATYEKAIRENGGNITATTGIT